MKTAEKILVLGCVPVIILLAFLIVWKAGIFGVSGDKLEQDARRQQHIEEDWQVAQAKNEDLCAMLFYDPDREDYMYSIYLTHEGLSYGYFFRQGGRDAYMGEGVKGIVYEDKGIALLSLNQDKVSKIVVDKPGNRQETIQVDPGKPFVVVLPVGCEGIILYDAGENVVSLYDTYTG